MGLDTWDIGCSPHALNKILKCGGIFSPVSHFRLFITSDAHDSKQIEVHLATRGRRGLPSEVIPSLSTSKSQ